jgi:hypothetical protein
MSALPEVLRKAVDTEGLLAPSEVMVLVDALEEAVTKLRCIGDTRLEVLHNLERP